MREILARIARSGVLGTFLAGMLAILPLILTVVIINWLVGVVRRLFGPDSLFGELLTTGGSAIIGPENDHLAFLIGLAIALVGIWGVGVIATAQARRTVTGAIDKIFNRVPLLATVYKPVAQVIRLLDSKGESELRGMHAVVARLGGAEVLALLASPQEFTIGGERRRLIYLPTSPVVTGGVLLFLPSADVRLVEGMKVEDAIKMIFSIGTLAPEVLPEKQFARTDGPSPAGA